MSNNKKWRWWIWVVAANWHRHTTPVSWHGLRVCGHLVLNLHSSNEPRLLLQWLCHQNSIISIITNIITIILSQLLSDEVLAWLSVWIEVQIICIWSSWCHCHPIRLLNHCLSITIITFLVSRRRCEMYSGHAYLCVCPSPHAHTTARTRM